MKNAKFTITKVKVKNWIIPTYFILLKWMFLNFHTISDKFKTRYHILFTISDKRLRYYNIGSY